MKILPKRSRESEIFIQDKMFEIQGRGMSGFRNKRIPVLNFLKKC